MKYTKYRVNCGYYACDIRYEFCSTGFVTPECLSCSGICSHYRVVNDPVATERCQSLCSEYWRIHNKLGTDVLSDPDDKLTGCAIDNTTIIILLTALIILVSVILLVIILTLSLEIRIIKHRGRKSRNTGYLEATVTSNNHMLHSRKDVTGSVYGAIPIMSRCDNLSPMANNVSRIPVTENESIRSSSSLRQESTTRDRYLVCNSSNLDDVMPDGSRHLRQLYALSLEHGSGETISADQDSFRAFSLNSSQ
ncbi:hypothetical protein LSH36_127g05033 [Paralvinella palmiformis]|uniref:Uncharacterized protein n=1 Tax=Paralvinella palmiformis TaxID=53620 RepID=A0AAD9NA84_9ANNE|nr:hypothetical protein LSH36_127g05033 [Paralvinella palmiformis]